MSQSRTVFEVSVYCAGVKKRCRKADRHSFNLGEIEFKELSSEDVNAFMEKAKTSLKENMKETQKAILHFRKVSIGDMFKTMELFDKANKDFNIEL
jgi:hypothetical protein